MKIRTDFVSNSSSSSFIVMINNSYSLFDFSKDLAKESINKAKSNHDEKLQSLNEVNLAYCLSNYELLFLGSYKVRTTERIIKKDELLKKLKNGFEYTKSDWNYEISIIKKWNKIKNSPNDKDFAWMKRNCSKNYLEEKTQTLHVFDDYYEGQIAMNFNDDFRLQRTSWFDDEIESGKANSERVKLYSKEKNERIKAIKEICMKHSKNWNHTPESYNITLNTIRNTKDMIEAGIELEFSEWENLDELEKNLRAGKQIFAIRMNNSGDGYLKDGIYLEEGSNLRLWKYKTKFEILDSESE